MIIFTIGTIIIVMITLLKDMKSSALCFLLVGVGVLLEGTDEVGICCSPQLLPGFTSRFPSPKGKQRHTTLPGGPAVPPQGSGQPNLCYAQVVGGPGDVEGLPGEDRVLG